MRDRTAGEAKVERSSLLSDVLAALALAVLYGATVGEIKRLLAKVNASMPSGSVQFVAY